MLQYVFEVVPQAIGESMAKSLSYWSTWKGDDTMITIWNPADEAQDFIFTLFFSGGSYKYPMPLGPRVTRTFNISEIIHSQIPDADGNVVPTTVHEGSAKISGSRAEHERILVGIAVGVYNVQKATCPPQCTKCDTADDAEFNFDPFDVAVGGTTTEKVVVRMTTGTIVDASASATWKSSNTAVASVSAGTVKGVSAGTITLSATTTQNWPTGGFDCGEGCPETPVQTSSPGTSVPPPTISGFDPNPIMIGTSPPNGQLTINGSNFGSSPTVNLPTGITSTGQGSTDTQIVLTGVSVALTATVGNNNVTVSANGAASGAAALTVDGPYQMVVQSDVTGKCSGCKTTVERDTAYQITDFSGENAGATSVCETVTYTGWTCTQAQNVKYRQCTAPYTTPGTGVLTDSWSLNSDGYTPAGCGLNVLDHWDWAAHDPVQVLGTLTGYLHTNAVSINGVVSPNQIPAGTVIPF
jgi:hypothetical protein